MNVFISLWAFYNLAILMGFSPKVASQLTCIARFESSMNQYAQNRNSNKSMDHGVLQINDVWLKKGRPCHHLNPYEPAQALQCAKIVVKKQGLKAWVMYNKNKKICDTFKINKDGGI